MQSQASCVDSSALVVAAGASRSPRCDPAANQDAFGIIGEGTMVAVADGVGSLPRSGEAAALAISQVTELWLRPSSRVTEAYRAADMVVRSALGETGATTLLSARSTARSVELAWVGNGAIFEICETPWTDGRPPESPGAGLCWTNLLVPHLCYEHGRDRLNHLIGGTLPAQPDSVVLTVTRPSLFLLVTDGVHSLEQLDTGCDENGDHWVQQTPQVRELLTLAGGIFGRSHDQMPSAQELRLDLETSLDRLQASNLLDDDATVGALFVDPNQRGPQ